MKLTIVNGANEIGHTCVKIETAQSVLLIDLGTPLSDDPKKELSYEEITGQTSKPVYFLLSHPHQDHYGLAGILPHEIPKFMSEGAKKLIEVSNIFLQESYVDLQNVQTFKDRVPFSIGADITVTAYKVCHSAFDSYAFLIESKGKKIFYSGDFRGKTGRQEYLFPKLLKEVQALKPDVLLLEGTRISRKSETTETMIEQEMVKLFKDQKAFTGIVIASQNIDRIVSIYKAVRTAGKQLIISPYEAYVLEMIHEVAPSLPQFHWDGIRVYFSRNTTKALLEYGHKKEVYAYRAKKITLEEIQEASQDFVWLLKDNSLYDRIFNRIDTSQSVMCWSLWDGYLSRKDNTFEIKVKSKFKALRTDLHCSGHAGLEEMKALAECADAKYLIPIHTCEPKEYEKHFQNVKILNNNEVFEL